MVMQIPVQGCCVSVYIILLQTAVQTLNNLLSYSYYIHLPAECGDRDTEFVKSESSPRLEKLSIKEMIIYLKCQKMTWKLAMKMLIRGKGDIQRKKYAVRFITRNEHHDNVRDQYM
jgi:hypothetical protein